MRLGISDATNEAEHAQRDADFMRNELDPANMLDAVALEELAAYLVEYGDQSPSIMRRFIASLKKFSQKYGYNGIIGGMTANDLVVLAQGAIRTGRGGTNDARGTGTSYSRGTADVGLGRPMGFPTLYSLVEGSRGKDEILGAIQAGYARGSARADAAHLGAGVIDNELLLEAIALEAMANGAFINDIRELTQGGIGAGAEAFVYLSNSGSHAIKVNATTVAGRFVDFLIRIAAHNKQFPESSYRIIGITHDDVGHTAVVLQQPFVHTAARPAQQDEIDAELRRLGFRKEDNDLSGALAIWYNADRTVEITDAKPENVLIDGTGKLHFIDTVIYDDSFSRLTPEELFNVINPETDTDTDDGDGLLYSFAEVVVPSLTPDGYNLAPHFNPAQPWLAGILFSKNGFRRATAAGR